MLLKSFLRHRCLSLALAVVVSAAARAPLPAARADEAMATAQAAHEAGDHARALEIWLLEAYEGNPEAQYRLGRMFADGTGTVADAAEAVYWYTRAAEQGHATAQYELGSASFHGLGTNPDKEAALTWWRVAAENGSADAQYQLGRAYFYGIDIAQDAALAIEYLGDAADNGHRLAREFLDRVGGSAAGAESGSEGADWAGYGRVASRPIWVYGSYNRFSPIVTRLEPGSLVRVVERQGGWFRVQVPGGLPVWVAAARLAEDGAGHSVDGPGVAARPDPGNDPGTRPLGMFTEGDSVRLLERRGDWVRVQAPETISGWVEAVDIVEIDDTGEQIARAWREAARSTALDEGIAGRPTVVLPSAGRTAEEDAAGAAEPAQPVAAADDSTGQVVALADSEVDSDARTDAAAEDSPVDAETQVESGEPTELAAAADTPLVGHRRGGRAFRDCRDAAGGRHSRRSRRGRLSQGRRGRDARSRPRQRRFRPHRRARRRHVGARCAASRRVGARRGSGRVAVVDLQPLHRYRRRRRPDHRTGRTRPSAAVDLRRVAADRRLPGRRRGAGSVGVRIPGPDSRAGEPGRLAAHRGHARRRRRCRCCRAAVERRG
ncbi:MAG: hypothetical protein M5U09_16745 [Gammaproteobacteria bacterium]|nr:hypothetical protein [Gammaproteobacteria bacterium]